MSRYTATFQCRKVGAIGIYYAVTEVFETDAVTPDKIEEAARVTFYARGFEHLHLIRLAPLPEKGA